MPRVIQTLEHPTLPKPTSIEKASVYLGSDWGLTGKETPEEKTALTGAFKESVRWLASWIDGLEPYWLVMVGVSGTGKSMLTKALAKYCDKHGSAVFDRTVRASMSAFSQDHDMIYSYRQEGSMFVEWRNLVPHGDENRGRIDRAARDWVKFIDDLKAQTGEPVTIEGEQGVQPKRFESSAAGDLLDARLRKWTVVNSNLTRKQLAMFWDVRIASRLTRDGNTIVDLSQVRDFFFRK